MTIFPVNIKKPGDTYRSAELTLPQKQTLTEAIVRKGMRASTSYNRFFRYGFKEWELIGTLEIIKSFAPEFLTNDIPENFYKKTQNKRAFIEHMHGLGMCEKTVIKRFKAWDFKEWEMEGITAILNELSQ